MAGRDTAITLPLDSASLDGSKSSDPDGKISAWQWTKISGPASFQITNAKTAITIVKKLVVGVYQFELQVTDDEGASTKDTVRVTVQSVPHTGVCDTSIRATITIQLTPVASIPTPRFYPTAVTIGNKLLVAGGSLSPEGSDPVSDVNIYDFSTQSWSTAHLSMGRESIPSATVGNKVFFAGGDVSAGVGGGFVFTTRVDIYDATTNTWSSSGLPDSTYLVSIAAVGNKVFFTSDRAKVDIYDISTGFWSEVNLSEPRTFTTATTVDNKVYFAGGVGAGGLSTVVDIYDNATGTWSTSSLSQPTYLMASIYADGKIYWAGGVIGYDPDKDHHISTCQVEIRDVSTQTSSFTNLSRPAAFYSFNQYRPIFYKSKIIFPVNNFDPQGPTVDIYDPQSNTWSIGKLPPGIFVQSLVSVNNALYAVGNVNNDPNNPLVNQIWKLQY